MTSYEPEDMLLTEEFYLAVKCANQDDVALVETSVEIDLAEFALSFQELQKLSRVLRRLNAELTLSFSKVCAAASVFTQIVPKEQRSTDP